MLRRPVKYNPDKRDFVLTEQALNNFEKAQKTMKPADSSDLFETASDYSRTES